MNEHKGCAEDSSKNQVQEKEHKALKSFITDEAQEGYQDFSSEREYSLVWKMNGRDPFERI
jgi:hypothetical protein